MVGVMVIVLGMIVLYICTNFYTIIFDPFKVIERTQFHTGKLQREIPPPKCRWSYDSCSLYIVQLYFIFQQNQENILYNFEVIERTQFSYEIFQRGIIPQKLIAKIHFVLGTFFG